MVGALVMLLIVVLIVGFLAWLATLVIDRIPMDGAFRQIAKVVVFVVAFLVILLRALPLLGVSL